MSTLAQRTPRVGIGVAVYNGERFLPQTLDSLLAQTYRDFELIICDNCSADRTEQICRSYAERDARVRYHRNSANIGAPRNFNLAFSMSRGEYFKWSGADDLCAPEMIERCVRVLDQRPEVVLAYPKTRLVDENGAALNDYDDRLDLQFEAPHKRLSHLLWNIRMCNAVFGLIRSNALRSTTLFGSYSNSDLAFLAELALYGRFAEIREFLFFRRARELSVDKYPSVHDRMVMFDPSNVGRLVFPNWKLFAGHFSAIRRAPLSWSEKLLCCAKMHIWLRRRGADLTKDLKFAAKHLLGKLVHRIPQDRIRAHPNQHPSAASQESAVLRGNENYERD